MTYVYDFDEPCAGGRTALGGKGLGLAEMTQLGLRVPHGFTITTDACRDTSRGGDLPAHVLLEVDEHLARLEHRTGKRFGGDTNPLLLSVRSGGPTSMPGMMDTILNLGLTRRGVLDLVRATGDRRFAFDSYRLHYEELTLRGAFHHTPATVRAALAFLASGAYPWERLVTHEIPLEGLPGLFSDPPRDLLKAAVRP